MEKLTPEQQDMCDVFCKKYKLDLNKFSEANNNVEITIHGLDTQINGYKERIKELEQENKDLEDALRETQSELGDMEYDLDEAKDELYDAECDISNLKDELSELKQSITFMNESINHIYLFETFKVLLDKYVPVKLEEKLKQL